MKIVCISDTHLEIKGDLKLPDGDVLIHAGDHTHNGTKSQLNDAAKWLGQYRTQFERVFTVAGNHDFIAQDEPGFANIAFARHGVKYLEDQGVWYNDVYFYGSPWQPYFFQWAFNFPEKDGGIHAKRVWDYIPARTNVLITHGPPLGILDKTKGGWDTRVGCPHLLDRIGKLKHLKLHVFGHIHEQNGELNMRFSEDGKALPNWSTAGFDGSLPTRDITFVNAAICDRANYDPVQPYHEVTI